MPNLVGKIFTDIPADLSTRQYVNQRSAFGGTTPMSGNVICFQQPNAGAPLSAAQNIYVFVIEAKETCPAHLGDLRPQPTPTPTPSPIHTYTAYDEAMARVGWLGMDTAARKTVCDGYAMFGRAKLLEIIEKAYKSSNITADPGAMYDVVLAKECGNASGV
ncbi:hypothetical protein J7E97_04915 [Streptomyces sp. ISL-66]|nr:hypothetical protein [Streptomyces sp. ISL-66]